MFDYIVGVNIKTDRRMKQIKVTFWKETTDFHFHKKVNEVSFAHNCTDELTDYENQCSAFDKAVSLGHDPSRRIRMEWI